MPFEETFRGLKLSFSLSFVYGHIMIMQPDGMCIASGHNVSFVSTVV